MENKSKYIFVGVILILLVLLGISVNKNFETNKELEKTVQKTVTLNADKSKLQSDLDKALEEIIALEQSNTALSDEYKAELAKAKEEILALQTQLGNEKSINVTNIDNYKKKIADLLGKQDNLMKKIESLTAENKSLNQTIEVTKTELTNTQTAKVVLENQIKEASVIKVHSIEANAVTQKSNGQVVVTDKYNKADGVKIAYKIVNNNFLKGKEYHIYYVLLGPNGKIISKAGEFALGGKTIAFSDGSKVIYEGDNMKINKTLAVTKGELTKGTYTLELYSDKELLDKVSFQLKSSFLGL